MAIERPLTISELAQVCRPSPTMSGMELRSVTMNRVPEAPTTAETANSVPVRNPSGASTSRSSAAAWATLAQNMTPFADQRARTAAAASPATNPAASRTAMNTPTASARSVTA
jgi:hypothetical protein